MHIKYLIKALEEIQKADTHKNTFIKNVYMTETISGEPRAEIKDSNENTWVVTFDRDSQVDKVERTILVNPVQIHYV